MQDIDHMRHALALGRRNMGATGKNPAVGCVLVKDGCVAGVGWTQKGGFPHAEAEALAMAKGKAEGATAYVTLEPCCHHGRTSPCTDALVSAGVARVVTALEDPDPRVEGKGHAALRKAGLTVESGLLAKEARRDLAGFLSRITRRRPHVILKLALSSDGMIASAPGRRTAITGEEANSRTHLMRAEADAIMVGVGTVRTDDPLLTCRLPGLEYRSPIAVIVDGALTTPRDARLLATARSRPVIILISASTRAGEIERQGVEIVRCRSTRAGHIDLADGLEKLAERGTNRLLVEGGANLARQLMEQDLVDEIAIFRSPVKLGGQGLRAEFDLKHFDETGGEVLGQDLLTRYERR
jgi:diaminohydroxyphosphoribosylaminopyrimidine deaminase/5-amino-6-(5-phosphoribosylamino)uracil reductase